MKSAALACIALFILLNGAAAAEPGAADAPNPQAPEVELDLAPAPEEGVSPPPPPELAAFCFFAGNPPVEAKYTVIKQIKLGKGTYGGVTQILPKFAGYAQKIGADAVINYTGSQRFGFWPWRLVRPVVRGTAIKWDDPKDRDCASIGGTSLATILESDKPPAR